MSQESFDFNGNWDGVTTDGSDTLVQFTIKNNVLVTASCRSDLTTETVPLSIAIRNGEFSSAAKDAVMFSGRIVSASQAIGLITPMPPCNGGSHSWWASKLVP